MRTKLIEILKRCGVSQVQIADRLGTAQSAVSAWASGKRAMPLKHELALFQWAVEAELTALEDARALDAAAAPRHSLLTGDDWEQYKLRNDLARLWHDYNWEVAEEAGHELTASILASLRRFAIYTDAEPMTTELKRADIDRLEADVQQLRKGLATWRRLNPEPSPSPGDNHDA